MKTPRVMFIFLAFFAINAFADQAPYGSAAYEWEQARKNSEATPEDKAQVLKSIDELRNEIPKSPSREIYDRIFSEAC